MVTVRGKNNFSKRCPATRLKDPMKSPLVCNSRRTPEGQLQHILVTAVSETGIEVDANHPLAGEVLHFSVEIVDVRDATAEELEHGHAHTAG